MPAASATMTALVSVPSAARAPAIPARILSARLSELHQRGVILCHVRPTSPPSVEYERTKLGRKLVPALESIIGVGHRLKALGYG